MGRFERVTADLQEMQEKNAGLKAMDTQCMVSIAQTLAAMYDLLDERLSGLDRIQAAAGGITVQNTPDIGKLAEESVCGCEETNEEI
jgi:hypothetical protein